MYMVIIHTPHSHTHTHTHTHSDIDEIYNGIGDNLAKLIQSVTSFFAAIVVGFVREWRLALILLAIVPFMALAAAVFTKVQQLYNN